MWYLNVEMSKSVERMVFLRAPYETMTLKQEKAALLRQPLSRNVTESIFVSYQKLSAGL